MDKIEKLHHLRHTTSHLLAAAVLQLWPDTKRAIGPATETGFYYDFDFAKPITDEDLPKIEEEMKKVLQTWTSIKKNTVSVEQAKDIFKNEPYKLELIEDFDKTGETLTTYKTGSYEDLCKGGHIENPKEGIGAFKLLSLAGAYWKGNEKNKMLTRIYGTAFETNTELDEYLHLLEEAKKRDHKKLAKELDLIVFSDLVGAGLPLYTPKGALLRSTVYNFSRALNQKIGYLETAMPSMNKGELFKVSGHYEKYFEDMFQIKSNYSHEEFFLKPMNCPQHCVIYGSRQRSYRDLPIRYADFSVLYRDEKPGQINGLLRSRAFTQDDGHCFCREDQIEEEFVRVLGIVDEALKAYGFEYWIRLSLRDPDEKIKYLGDDAVWELAETKLKEIVKASKVPFVEGLGEAAIYGPKLDFMTKDSLGREWQLSTIQLDMIMPIRFGLSYTDSDGSKKSPFMIHRAIVGSERFIAILIEHYAGAFPLWLSPVQVMLLPIADRHVEYAKEVNTQLQNMGIKSEIDDSSETLQAKIRNATLQKVPFMGIIGDKEIASSAISVRSRAGENLGSQETQQFADKLKQDIDKKV